MAGQASVSMGLNASRSGQGRHRGPKIGDTVVQAGGGIKADAQLLARGVGLGEVGVGPLGVFAHQLDVGVAGLGNFGETLLKGQLAKNRP